MYDFWMVYPVKFHIAEISPEAGLFNGVKKYFGLLVLLIAILCWGPAPVVTKLALTEIPEFSFAFFGRIIAFIILAAIFIPRGFLKIKRHDLPMLILAGLTGSVFNVGFFIFGIQQTNTMDAQAIFSVGPVVNAILVYFILKEKIKPIQGLGVAVGFIGAVLIATRTFFETGTLSQGNLFGDLLIFIASISWVGYILISKKLSRTYSPQTITLYSFFISSVVFAPLALFESFSNSSWIHIVSFQGIFGILYNGIFASVIAFLAYQTGLRLTSAFAAGVILYLNPVATTLFAVPILGEKITAPFVIGALLIILGSIIATQHEHVRKNVNLRFLRI